jgi:hypothetical protein
MNAKPKGIVTLPRRAVRGIAILQWALEVNRCLQQLRDRIITIPTPRSRAAAVICSPWEPTFINTSTTETPAWEVSFAFGTVNGMAPSNWDASFSLSATGTYWPSLTINADAASGAITSALLTLEATLPAGDPIGENALPTSKLFPLGVISNLTSCMIYNEVLVATGIVRYRASKVSLPYEGAEPFDRFYAWNITETG